MARTFATARTEILLGLQVKGWNVRSGLKVPHATSPDGRTRLWFKPQAVYVSRGVWHEFSGARTLDYSHDIRTMTTDQLIALAGDRA